MTCTEFLAMLDDVIDDQIAAEQTRAEIEQHMKKCSHCEVVFNTTQKTIQIYRSHELYELPNPLRERLHTAIMEKCAQAKKPAS
jgi:predicted anti-sigma-YlaC factor YlaD